MNTTLFSTIISCLPFLLRNDDNILNIFYTYSTPFVFVLIPFCIFYPEVNVLFPHDERARSSSCLLTSFDFGTTNTHIQRQRRRNTRESYRTEGVLRNGVPDGCARYYTGTEFHGEFRALDMDFSLVGRGRGRRNDFPQAMDRMKQRTCMPLYWVSLDRWRTKKRSTSVTKVEHARL